MDVLERRSGSKLEHDLRLWEAESAVDMKMTLEDWYKLPLIEREHIVATKVAGRWLESIMIDDAVNEANS